MAKPDGGTAFPNNRPFPNDGMSLRDYFAAQYLAGRAAREGIDSFDEVADDAYSAADAMLKARKAA